MFNTIEIKCCDIIEISTIVIILEYSSKLYHKIIISLLFMNYFMCYQNINEESTSSRVCGHCMKIFSWSNSSLADFLPDVFCFLILILALLCCGFATHKHYHKTINYLEILLGDYFPRNFLRIFMWKYEILNSSLF